MVVSCRVVSLFLKNRNRKIENRNEIGKNVSNINFSRVQEIKITPPKGNHSMRCLNYRIWARVQPSAPAARTTKNAVFEPKKTRSQGIEPGSPANESHTLTAGPHTKPIRNIGNNKEYHRFRSRTRVNYRVWYPHPPHSHRFKKSKIYIAFSIFGHFLSKNSIVIKIFAM